MNAAPVVPTPPPPSRAPILLRSLSAAVLTDGSGDLTLRREARGAVDDWGGVYAQLVRLTGPWRIFLHDGTSDHRLADALVAGARSGDRWTGTYRLGGVAIRQEIAPTDRPAGAVRTLRFSAEDGIAHSLLLYSSFVPYLLPTLVEGIRPRAFRAETSAEGLTVRQHGFGLSIRSNILPSHLYVNHGSWIGGRRVGPIEAISTEHEVAVAPGAEVTLRCLIAGGLERDLDRSGASAEPWLADPEPALGDAERAEAAWLAGTPRLGFPDAPELEAGYASARAALRQLYCTPGDGLTGLVAGYPWYSAIWGRDLAWMLPAVLWLGDVEWAERAVSTVFRFQARSNLPLLGGEPGELPMQVAPGPVFLYGTSDTTLYFPGLVERIVRHGGDASPLTGWLPTIRKIVAWGLARTDPASGLLRHGGEAEEISDATASLARVRYGIDAPDTTIWDSTDRRDHAIDVQVLWLDALRTALGLDPTAGDPAAAERMRGAAARLAATIPSVYDWPEEQYLVDSIRAGRAVRRLRPNALRAVSAGVLDPARARAVVERAARPDLTAPWGVRTLSDRDPGYRADAYHDGQVWTIATAWAADAAFAVGDPERGVAYLRTIAERFVAEGGGANECYRGDRAEPYNSCFLLGLSVGPFLSVLFERLWGLVPDGRTPSLIVRPRFPAAWRAATLDGLRVGPGRVSLAFVAPTLTVGWTGPGPLAVAAGGRTDAVAAGSTAAFALPPGRSAD